MLDDATGAGFISFEGLDSEQCNIVFMACRLGSAALLAAPIFGLRQGPDQSQNLKTTTTTTLARSFSEPRITTNEPRLVSASAIQKRTISRRQALISIESCTLGRLPPLESMASVWAAAGRIFVWGGRAWLGGQDCASRSRAADRKTDEFRDF